MPDRYTSQTYINASAQLEAACEWLQRIGINYLPTRLGKYRKLFSTVAKHQQSKTLDTFLIGANFEEWVNAVHEVAEINRIFEGLSAEDDETLVQRLKKSLKGHEKNILEKIDTSGRDFSLELSVAAKFVRKGYLVDFGHDADVAVEIEDFRFYVECKRLKSRLQVEKRISEGLVQLVRRYESSPNPSKAHGILVLSIGRIANPNLGLLVADSYQALGEAAFRLNLAFIAEYNSCWQTNVDKRTLGVCIILDSPGCIQAENKLVTIHEITMNNSVSINSEEHKIIFPIVYRAFG